MIISQSNPLKSPAFEQILSEAVPQQNSHLGKPWFHEKLTRQQAEDMLKRVRMDGAFLIRPSEQHKDTFSISFRCVGWMDGKRDTMTCLTCKYP